MHRSNKNKTIDGIKKQIKTIHSNLKNLQNKPFVFKKTETFIGKTKNFPARLKK